MRKHDGPTASVYFLTSLVTCKEQLVPLVKFVDPDNGKANTEFLAINDVLEHSTSANAEAIKTVSIKQLNESQL